MARVKLEYIHLDSLNMSLVEALNHCDSVKDAQRNVIIQLDDLLGIKEDQIENLKQQNVQHEYKYVLSAGVAKKERKLKWIFLGSTVVMAGFLALSLL